MSPFSFCRCAYRQSIRDHGKGETHRGEVGCHRGHLPWNMWKRKNVAQTQLVWKLTSEPQWQGKNDSEVTRKRLVKTLRTSIFVHWIKLLCAFIQNGIHTSISFGWLCPALASLFYQIAATTKARIQQRTDGGSSIPCGATEQLCFLVGKVNQDPIFWTDGESCFEDLLEENYGKQPYCISLLTCQTLASKNAHIVSWVPPTIFNYHCWGFFAGKPLERNEDFMGGKGLLVTYLLCIQAIFITTNFC